MNDLAYTPWFNVEENGSPVRNGVYEGAAVGVPGQAYVLQHGFYYWNGRRWSGFGRTPQEAAERFPTPFRPRNWRGIIPSEDYPFESVETHVPRHFTGVLRREGAADHLTVRRLEEVHVELHLECVREHGAHEAENYECVLYRQGAEFVGSGRAVIRGFDTNAPVEVRVSTKALTGDLQSVTASLRDARRVFVFSGDLQRQPST